MSTAKASTTQGISRLKMKVFEWFLSDASAATAETMEILMDIDQTATLLSSLDDVRQGKVVSLKDAFGDL